MNIIISGPDSVGKTTLVNKCVEKYNMMCIHSTASTRNDLSYHMDLLDYCDNTVFDRFHSGEYVFPKLYNREPKMSFDDLMTVNKRIVDNNDIFIIMYCSDSSVLKERLETRDELDYLEEIEGQLRLYYHWIDFCNAFFDCYDNYYVCDVSEPGAYDDLDDWLDDHYGKQNVNTVYRSVCKDIIEKGHPMETRNVRGNTLELCNYSFTIDDISNSIVTLKTGKANMVYLAGELLWYMSSRNDTEFISKFSKLWSKLTDDGKTNNSAYGFLLQEKHGFNQIEKIIELLEKDPFSRRAVLNINVPNENVIDTKDEPCTICLIYQIRNGKLHCTCVMRSNDVVFGLRNDLGYFLTLQKYIAKRLDITVGTYTHFAASIHCYAKDYKMVKDVAYGNMEQTEEVLYVDELLRNQEFFIDYIDNHWESKLEFEKLLRSKGCLMSTSVVSTLTV